MIASRTATALVCALLVASGLAGCAPSDEAGPRLLRIVATEFAFEAPREVEAGLTRVRLVNRGRAWHYALVAELPPGASVETYLAGARAGEDFPAAAVDVGGPGLVTPGDSSEVVLDLQPGRYALICWYDNHLMAGMIAPLSVREARGARPTPLPHDGEVVMRDFAFALSRPLQAGVQVLRVTNVGTRAHEFDVYRLEPGRTRADFDAWQEGRRGPPPAVPVGGVADFVPGREVWVRLALGPGRYVITCEVPEGEQTHADLGMVEEFEVR